MTTSSFAFTQRPVRAWSGRYSRIPGDTTAFHVRAIGDQWWPCVDWVLDDMLAVCPMVDQADAAELGRAVNRGKHAVGGSGGGAFLVNEYGQVLVPSSNGDRVALVGECSGPLEFHDTFSGDGTFDLANDHGLRLGDRWDRPYLGIPHNLSSRSEIYFKLHDGGGIKASAAPVQDARLIEALRTLRPSGAVRFVVTYGGIVLTKVPVGPWSAQRWEPRYVGRLDYRRWYPKEV